ncbi:Enniatin synthetase [Paramyrothecium foliicola]|nr:Enniatin synthetase [Paramyrothecium foliicola]
MTIQSIRKDISSTIAYLLRPMTWMNFSRALAGVGRQLPADTDLQCSAKLWDILFRHKDYLEHVLSLDGSIKPALLGADLLSRHPKYLCLILSDRSGEAKYKKEMLFNSFREQDYEYDQTHAEVRFRKSGITLHIGDAVEDGDWITMKDPTRLFRQCERDVETAVSYYKEDCIIRVGPTEIGGVEDYAGQGKKRVEHICSLPFNLGNGLSIPRVVFQGWSMPLSLVSKQNQSPLDPSNRPVIMILNASQLLLLFVVFLVSFAAYGRHLFRLRPYPSPDSGQKKITRSGWTVRVRGVPLDWDAKRLAEFLAGSSDSAPTIKSLAQEVQEGTQSATASFQAASDALRKSGFTRSIELPRSPKEETTRPAYLQVDDGFHGITTLFIPPKDDHRVDVIALSGLGGHAFGSFKQRAGDYMWLRDALPYDLTSDATGQPMVRVITFGYESGVAGSRNMQNLEDLATMLHNSLLPLVSSPIVRPIIFVAHSLGGLIVKQALISLSKSKNEEDQRLLHAVYGVVFFGVPHDGMDITSLIPMVGDGPNRFLVESLNRINSQILSLQQREFETALGEQGDSEVVCFYETEESPTAQKNSAGHWAMDGPPTVLVSKASATHGRSWENGAEHICAVARTHSNLVKFDPHDHEYDKVRERLRGLAHRALNGGRRTQVIVPYTENPSFVGRSTVMEALKHELGYSRRIGTTHARVSLYGLGGVGKTQIALAYVYQIRKMRQDVSVFWVHASNAARFRQSRGIIAQECQIPGYEDPKNDVPLLVKAWLESQDRGHWLMVLDNADDLKLFFERPYEASNTVDDESNLQRYLPECAHGALLATSRDKKLAVKLSRGQKHIEVGRMGDEESKQLLHARHIDATSANISALSSRLEHLPLALAQAAAYIEEESITVSQYLDLLGENDQNTVQLLSKEFETVGRDSETPRAVAQTWILSFQKIEQQHALASELLSFMSLLDRQGIPAEFLSHYVEQRESEESLGDIELTEALGALKAFSFITEDKNGSYDMHRLVQLVTRKWLTSSGTVDRFRKETLMVVSHLYPYGKYETRITCAAYLSHANTILRAGIFALRDEAEAKASLLHCMAAYFMFEGKWIDAKALNMGALRIRRELFGENDPSTLRSMANLASTFWNQGLWDEAEKLFVQVMEISKTKLGADHPSTLTSMANLASTYSHQGRWEEAEKLEVQVMETFKIKLGADHPDTLMSMANLASTYRKQGRWDEAEKLELQVMETRKIKLGLEHPDTLTSMNNLASTYSNQGRWEEAEKLDMQVMEISKIKLGADHPDTLMSMANLASTYRDQGRWDEAEKLDMQVMETRKIKLGADYLDTLTSMANLASTYSSQGRWEEAEKLELQVMETFKIKLGADHPDTLTSMANLASMYSDQGRWDEAEKLEVQVIKTRKIKLGADHPDTLTSMNNLAYTWHAMGKVREARDLMETCIQFSELKLGLDHPNTQLSISTFNTWKGILTQATYHKRKLPHTSEPDRVVCRSWLGRNWNASIYNGIGFPLLLTGQCDCAKMRVLKQDLGSGITSASVNSDNDYKVIWNQVARHYGLSPGQIEAILPCTPFQHDVLNWAACDPRRAVGQATYNIAKNVDIDGLAAAWEEVVRQTPTLRTCMFSSKAGDYFQVVLSDCFTWKSLMHPEPEEIAVENEATVAMTGAQCNRYAVFNNPSTKERHLIWTFNHALVDSAFQEVVLWKVLMAYDNGKIPRFTGTEELTNPLTDEEERVAQFWQQHFDNLIASVFPVLPLSLSEPCPSARAEHRILCASSSQQKEDEAVVCQAALAVLLARYTNATEALFGVVLEQPSWIEGQEEPIDGPTRTIPTIAAVRGFEQTGLEGICSAGDFASAACGFQTVLVVTSDNAQQMSSKLHQLIKGADRFAPYSDRALLLHCQMMKDSATLFAHYDPKVIDKKQIGRFLRQLGYLIKQFRVGKTQMSIAQISIITPEDRAEIERWNSNQLQTTEACIHDVISKRATTMPHNSAIVAWDGEWSYAELDDLSLRLAGYLHSLDLTIGTIVPLCFEKSKWIVVGIIAVLKAGHAFTLIDPSVPQARIAQICQQISATVALTTENHCDSVQAIVPHCIVVNDDLVKSPKRGQNQLTSTAKPHDLAYVIFTSGSTGEPKGSMIEHRGFTSCSREFGPAFGINNRTRALQFASYAFGACLMEILTTLMHGGCVCIPSEDDRINDIPAFISRAGVNWALFTPSFIGAIEPESVPSLETLVLVGEPMSAEMRDTWASRVRLLYGYGQSESSTACSVAQVDPGTTNLNNIGCGAGARLWITDTNNADHLAPVGCIGELVIESPGIARGYLDAALQDTSQSQFLSGNPAWYSQTRQVDWIKFYRTGDLVYYRFDGTVAYIGRRDLQVKIRGQRVDLGDVESHLRRQLPSHLTIAAEIVQKTGAGNESVPIAFIMGPARPDDEAGLRLVSGTDGYMLENSVANRIGTQLREAVPNYCVPSFYVRMENVPATVTGKTDRKTLKSTAKRLLDELNVKEPSRPEVETGCSVTSPLEVKLREAWRRSLKLNPDGMNDESNFFQLGGDSIAAIKLVNMARSLGFTLTVADVFHSPTLAGLAARARPGSNEHSLIPRGLYSGPVEQSFAQGRLWFLDQLNVGASWYMMPLTTRLRGPLDIDALTTALNSLEQRHETLRTTFEERDGVGVQIVHEAFFNKLRVINMSEMQRATYTEILGKEQTTPFDLTSEPGWRVALLRLEEKDHILSIAMHHIISDGWSIDLLRQELGQFYAAALRSQNPLSQTLPLPVQYRDFAVWQKQEDQQAEHQRQLDYWTDQLADSVPAELLCDKSRPAVLSGGAGVVPLAIEGHVYEKLQAFCIAHQVTAFTVLLAAFRAAHFRLTGVEDATIGTPIANRNRPELEDMIGFFINTQCMRIAIEDGETFEGLVRQVRSTTTAAFDNQDVPFERIVSALLPGSRDASRNPLVQLMFAVHSQRNLGMMQLEGLDSEAVPVAATTRLDLEFHLFQEEGRLGGSVLFATDLFEPETIRSLVSVFQEVLRRSLDEPQTPIAVLPLTNGLSELDGMGLLEIERTDYPREASVVDVFRDQVAACPDAVAVKDSSSLLTYTELDQKSDELAAWLRQRRLAAETLVGVLAPRSCETIVAFLGILKANLAYLPLDVNVPAARIEAILSAVPGPRLVLTGNEVAHPDVQLSDVEWVKILDCLGQGNIKDDAAEMAILPSATSLAYVMFTSGSTGKPKGVMVEHRAIVRLVKQSSFTYALPHLFHISHMTNLAFDISVSEIFVALLNGGSVICIDYLTTLDTDLLKAIFASERITVAMFAPVLLRQCLSRIPGTIAGLHVIFNGGDRLDGCDGIAARSLVQKALINAYGPTENGIQSTIYDVLEQDSFVNGVPIGRAVSNSGAYIMDPNQKLVGLGVMGELVVTGDGLARGYTNPSLNLNRFIQVEIKGETIRAYRTGDWARWRPKDGQIEFFGRMDQQIKIRGHRIEPAEVEHAMLSQKTVRDAAVVVRKEEGSEPELVAFVAAHGAQSIEHDEATTQVEGWRDHFDMSFYAGISTIDHSLVGNDFMGWTSMYDGSPIDKVEMHEWLDDTIQTLLDGRPAGHVLEIGTGTGMILFNLGEGLQSYVGLEPSRSAAKFVNSIIKSMPALADKAKVHVGTAMDIDRLDGLKPDVVVINSVAQYFPTAEYLSQAIDCLARIPSVKRLFFGDIRSYAINRDFLAARALHDLGANVTKDGVRRKMAELEAREEELLVDPTFFTRLTSQMTGRIKHVEILPKIMKATNELSAYRYAAIVHVGDSDELEWPVYTINADAWVDFQGSDMDRDALVSLIRSSQGAPTVAISNIPYSKTIVGRHIIESLRNDDAETSLNGADWVSYVHHAAQSCPSLSATDLLEVAKQGGFRVELSWARQRSSHGALDAVFHHHAPATERGRAMINFPKDEENRLPGPLTNRPLQWTQNRRLEARVRQGMQTLLPSYMMPAQIIAVDKMPTNANGKVDRRELTRRSRTVPVPKAPVSRVAPRNEVEAALCDEFAAVLGIEVGVTDNFFELGGHSLMATKLAARVSRRLDVKVSVKQVFDQPVVADLAAIIQRGSSKHRPISPTPYDGPVEQSFAQGRLWFLDQLSLGTSWYLIPLATRLRGPLRIDALTAALHALEQRHETMRTTFEERDGIGMQVVHESGPKLIRVIEVSAGHNDSYIGPLRKEQTTPFDLASEPGWRVSLLKLGVEDHILSIVMHHIVSDGWSVDVLRHELSQFYIAALQGQDPLSQVTPLPIQYRDFAAWQKQDDQMAEHQRQLKYWTDQLTDSAPAELLCDKPRPTVLSGDAGIVTLAIEGQVYERLQAFCIAQQTTPFVALLAVFRATHYRLTGAEDATIGTPIANRNRPELENLIGFFVNTQCMRIAIEDGETFEGLVRQVRSTTMAAFDHQDVPFERIVSALVPGSRDTSRNPLVQLIFALHSQHDLGKIQLEGLAIFNEESNKEQRSYSRQHVSALLFTSGEVQRHKYIDPNSKDEKSLIPLHQAAAEGYEFIVKMFLETEIASKDIYGYTPLHFANTNTE